MADKTCEFYNHKFLWMNQADLWAEYWTATPFPKWDSRCRKKIPHPLSHWGGGGRTRICSKRWTFILLISFPKIAPQPSHCLGLVEYLDLILDTAQAGIILSWEQAASLGAYIWILRTKMHPSVCFCMKTLGLDLTSSLPGTNRIIFWIILCTSPAIQISPWHGGSSALHWSQKSNSLTWPGRWG